MFSALFSGKCCCVEVTAAPQQIVNASTDEKRSLPHLLSSGSKDQMKTNAGPASRKPAPTSVKPAEDSVSGAQVTPPTVVQATPEVSGGAVFQVNSDTSSKSAKSTDAGQPIIAAGATEGQAETQKEDEREIVQTQLDPLREEDDQMQAVCSSGPREALTRAPRPDGAPMTTRTDHLEAMVAEFVRRAVRNWECLYLNEKNGRRTPVIYKISEDLEIITVEGKKRAFSNRLSRKWPTVALRDIDYFEAVESILKPKAVASLTADDKERLLMIFYGNGKLQHITLLMESRESRDLFTKGFKTLAASLRE